MSWFSVLGLVICCADSRIINRVVFNNENGIRVWSCNVELAETLKTVRATSILCSSSWLLLYAVLLIRNAVCFIVTLLQEKYKRVEIAQ